MYGQKAPVDDLEVGLLDSPGMEPNVPVESASFGPGAVLRLIREAGELTRGDLIARTGLGRSAVAQRVDALMASDLLKTGEAPSTGGRPPATLIFNHNSGVVLSADLGATHSRLAVVDLAGTPLAEVRRDIRIADGPETVLDWVEQGFGEVLRKAGRSEPDVRAIGIGVPGPVEFATGRPVSPPIMPGWDDFDIPARLRERHDVPVLVDNDVNIMALGEHWTTWQKREDLLYIKVGTGIGCGIVAAGDIYRGAQGAAGDIGHIRVAGHEDVLCECGNVACLEAIASGRAVARDLRDEGFGADNSRDVVALVKAQNTQAVRLVRQAGRLIGEVLAGLVNAFNPSVIVVGGDLAAADEQLFAGLREVVYRRSTALATRHLQIARSSLDDHAGVIGAAVMAIEHVLAPQEVDRRVLSDGFA
jgi:predicted NBD/HSP70 family sugar kinase